MTTKWSQAQYEADEVKEKDERMMSIIKDMVNSINPRFQITSDFPSAHVNKMMPVLAIQLYVDS
jgi:tetrahydromethanopterin S-methyltransferase subunit B